MKLLDDTPLERSSVVANSRMNRERGAFGVNSYEKELGHTLQAVGEPRWDYNVYADRIEIITQLPWLGMDLCERRRVSIEHKSLSYRRLRQRH